MSSKAKVKALEKRLRRVEWAGEEIEVSIEPVVCNCRYEDDEARERECPAFHGGTCKSISTS
ncbi:MAG TPA: hypothetical protein PKC29_06225 [Thermodesulfobacteriota bacterium]|nr:hypothetical protein [Thermodesulfobacteriota bacterium]